MQATLITTRMGAYRCLRIGLIFWALLLVIPASGFWPDSAGNRWLPAAAAADGYQSSEQYGVIDSLYEDKIVISDRAYVLSDLVIYYKDHTMTETAGRYEFTVGTPVGFLVNPDGEVELLYLYE